MEQISKPRLPKEHIDVIIADIRDGDLDALVAGTLISKLLDIPIGYLREPKKHGKRKYLEGITKERLDMLLEQGKNVYLLTRYKEVSSVSSKH